jgi:hypothetical protein
VFVQGSTGFCENGHFSFTKGRVGVTANESWDINKMGKYLKIPY